VFPVSAKDTLTKLNVRITATDRKRVNSVLPTLRAEFLFIITFSFLINQIVEIPAWCLYKFCPGISGIRTFREMKKKKKPFYMRIAYKMATGCLCQNPFYSYISGAPGKFAFLYINSVK